MGNFILGGARTCSEHIAKLEEIRNMHDEKKQELEIKRIIAENNYKIQCQEVLRLCKLDDYNFKKEMEKLRIELRKNDQLNERETKRIHNNHVERMKALNNEEEKINNEFKQTIRKLDDDKEINILRENNTFINEKDKIKLDFEAKLKHLENEELDIVNKRMNEKIRDQQEY